VDLRVLGPLEVERDGEVLGLGGRKQRSVLAVLVLHAREVIGGDRLADAIWDGRPPTSAQTTLRGYVSNLRKALEPDRGAADAPRILRTTPAGYVLDVADEQIDARRFERLVTSGRDRCKAGDVTGAVGEWTRALEMWRGEAFQDFAYSGFVQPEAARLEERRLACLEDLLDAQLELGRDDAVVGDLEAFCSSHPTRERALRLWMLALYRCGRQSDAIAAYDDGRRRLADELGVDPSPELRALHELIVRQDESLSPASVDLSPAGKQTLTFLLGDVERSTQKLRTLGDAYAGVLDEHRRLLLDVFGAHGGRAVRTWGDGVFAAFDVATDAVHAAVATQLALCGAGFSEDRTLPVRLGVHTGEATFADGEFVGLAIHLADRIMDAAHGAQILVSQATKDLLEAEEGTATAFLDTGAHSLKDFPDRVRLFQVVHPELRRDFPPLRTRSGRTDNLPNRLKSVVGRERDLEQIEETLAEARVVTLTGVGGVGKTTLAVEAGRRLVSEYPDGVWLCELASVDDAHTIVHEVASTLGVEQQPGRSMRESLLTALRQRESLMILDNCEHLLGPVAELVEDIVRESRTTDVLATSREAVGAEGERMWPVRSLPVRAAAEAKGATRLFEDRARDARPDFKIDERTTKAVESICSRLDGIPLAIELAAARVTSMAPAQIAKRLEEGFRFLRSGRRGAVDRHRTLHGAIEWSYAMLSDAERTLFDRLSVFAGGFTLDAAERVCGRALPLDVADGLTSLVAKSMLEADVSGEEARYSLLETMRQYGQDRLAERGEADVVLRAHATYCAQLMEELSGLINTSSEGVMPRLAIEFDNMRAAQASTRESGDVDLAMRLGANPPLWSALQHPEMFGWAEEAVAMPGSQDHQLFARALMIAYLGRGGREAAKLEEIADRILSFVDDPDPVKREWAVLFAYLRAANRGLMDEANRWADEYIGQARAGDAPLGNRVFALSSGGMSQSNAGEHAAGVALAEEANALARDGSSALEGLSLYYLGEAVLAEGKDMDRARSCIDRAIELFRANEMHFWVGVTLVSLASLRARHGDPLEALPMFAELIDRWRRLGDWARQWVTLRNLAELFGRLELDESAAVLATASVESETTPPNIGLQAERLAELQQVLAGRMGEDASAAACARARAMPDDDVVAYAKAEIDRALERMGAEV
jgi:predicted ATPase/DNA-binding SARP family transcriptional activator